MRAVLSFIVVTRLATFRFSTSLSFAQKLWLRSDTLCFFCHRQRKSYQPLTPPAVRPLVRFFSMDIKRITTGMVAKIDAAKRYCHSIML